jgi:glutathione-regulated potassium-efflux system ancillary protein KefG
MTPEVNTDDLVDSTEVADLLGLSHRNSVSTYLRRYTDFPRPVVERGGGRTRLWLKQEITLWRERRAACGLERT